MILCFKCKGYGHFANKCPSKKQEQPKVTSSTLNSFTSRQEAYSRGRIKALGMISDCMGGYLSVNFGQEVDVIVEILGLTKGDGEEIKRCYISYLDVFTSYYKTARAPQIPTKVEKDSESLVSYQWNMDRACAPKAVQKRKKKLEHFRIKLEDETDCNIQQTTHYEQDKDTICKKPSTSRISKKKDSYGSTSDDYIIIT
nr:ARID DNA-binding domain-containing protein [Tanacetum cinerariifolium]